MRLFLRLFVAISWAGGSAVSSNRVSPMDDPEPTTERRTVKSRPVFVLIALIGSCCVFGYAIYRLLKGMHL